MKSFLFIAFFLMAYYLHAQTTIKGRIVDSSNKPLSAATVQLNRDTGNTRLSETLTDSSGSFAFTNVDSGKYVITISFVGFGGSSKVLQIGQRDSLVSLGDLKLVRVSNDLATVVVTSTTPAITQKADTIQYSANQYKVNQDATTEDLVKKMPGITIGSDGTVTAHGETVKKVLIDGKEYFGDDASATLKNLPADVIDKIQVFDKLSDQAQFTGFDDGNSSKAINIVTKGGMKASQFGKVYAGYGTNDRYTLGGSVNFFNGNRRIALIGLSNNINQQNFSQQDLLGVLGTSGNNNSGGGGQRGGNGGGNRGGGNTGNFITGTSGGFNTTNSFGVNYSDVWAKDVNVTGSYFFNNTRNATAQHTNRENILTADSSIFYKEDRTGSNNNYNNRVNLRIEYKIDSANQLIFTPTIGFQNNKAQSLIYGTNSLEGGKVLSNILNSTNTTTNGYNFSANLLFRHAFKKRGRSISLGITPGLSDNTGDTYQDIFDTDTTGGISPDSAQLYRDRNSHTKSIAANIAYTEPVGKKAMFQLNYSPSWQNSTAKQFTYNYNDDAAKYNNLDTSLSNLFNNDIVKHNAGASYRIGDRFNNFMVGLNYQYTDMNSEQTYPLALTIHKTFSNLLPNVMFNAKLSAKSSIRLMYRAATQTPSVTQLQNVYNNNNPLFVTTGNPDLRQSYNNTLAARFTFTNTAKSSSLFLNAFVQQNSNYITNATYTASKDSFLTKTVFLAQGSQLSKPVNLDGYWSYRTFLTYSFPLKAIKTNINLNGGYNYTKQPGLINNSDNLSKNSGYSGGVVFASNISEYVDFNIGYNAGYNVVKNTLQPQLNNTYYSGNATASINLLSKKGWVFHTDLNNQNYTGLSSGFNQNYTLWNASAGKKFLKNQRGDLRLSVFDILKQNQSISRNVTESYIEDVQTNVLQRYFTLTFTYKINNVRSGKTSGREQEIRDAPRAPMSNPDRVRPSNQPPAGGSGNVPGGPPPGAGT